MKRISRMMGVTLLEIMLVLAIAAMIIVMSIRYYQSASSSSRINSAMNIITAVAAASENYLNVKGTFVGIGLNSAFAVYLPGAQTLSSPWGGLLTITSTASTITIGGWNALPNSCGQLSALIKSGNKITVDASNCTVVINAY